MNSLNYSVSGTAQHPPPEGSTTAPPLEGPLEEARNFFDADTEDNDPAPQLAVNAAARAAAPARPPPLIKPTPNIRDPKAAKRNSAATQGRTKSVAPAGSFCVMTQALHECATIQAAHVAPRKWHKSAPERIRNIEYHFGFPRAGRLNLDTRWNIFFLVALYHILYDNGGIILIPTLETLQLALKFTILNQKLQRLQADGTFTLEETDSYRNYAYPFHTLPYIRSHVNPCFIILNAWNTLNKATELPDVWTDDQKEAIQLIHHMAAFWLSPSSDGFQLDRDVERLAADPEELAPNSDHHSPPMHSSPMGDHAKRRALKAHAVHGSSNDNSEAGPSRKRVVDDVSDEDTPVAGPSKRPRTNALMLDVDSVFFTTLNVSVHLHGISLRDYCLRFGFSPA
ncbi:hypothetical protein CPB85DRAFT_1333259 [Mucidula mucida]|nr:hypothetical protein CPB85DRAFT_1333259 [Mucidula mucida]